MTWSKGKTAILAGAIVFVGAVTALVIYEFQQKAAREEDFVAYEIQHRSLLQKLFRTKVNEKDLRLQMVGAWRIAAVKSWGADDFTYVPSNVDRLKIFTLTNWCIIHHDADSNIVVEARGPYRLKGNVYTETIAEAYGGMAQFKGARPQFNVRVEGDKYYQMGLHGRPQIEEMWQRVQ